MDLQNTVSDFRLTKTEKLDIPHQKMEFYSRYMKALFPLKDSFKGSLTVCPLSDPLCVTVWVLDVCNELQHTVSISVTFFIPNILTLIRLF